MTLTSNALQAIGTLAAAIAALIALFVAWDQGRVMRAQQHASVMPILAGSVQIDESEDVFQVSIEVRNDGVGPAFVESARILSGGEPMRTMEEFNTTILPETLRQGATINGGTIRGALGAGRSQRLISFSWDRSEDKTEGFIALLERLFADDRLIQIETCYCSVFEQCWLAGPGDTARATTLRSCPHAGDDVYAQLSAGRSFGEHLGPQPGDGP